MFKVRLKDKKTLRNFVYMEDETKIEDRIFRNYLIVFMDGSEISLKEVAINSKENVGWTCFLNKDYRTVFVVSDTAMKYIKET